MSLTHIQSVLAHGGEHLGDLIWWHLAEAQVDRTTLETKWQDAGLAAGLLPEPPTAEKALRAAIRECHVGRQDRLIRLGKEDENELVFAIVFETRHPDGSVSFTQEARVFLNRKTEVLLDDNPSHDLVQAIRLAFKALRTTHTSDDIRRAMLRTLNASAAVSLREHGGIYWVPSPHAEQVRRLQKAIEQIGSSKVYLLPVHRSDDSERTLGKVARGSIEDELSALQVEIDSFLASPPERASTLVRRLDVFDSLRSKAALYRDVLRVQVDDIDLRLDKLSTAVESLIVQRAAA